MKYVLVTGGAGFIGSHLVDLLIKEEYTVHVVDNVIKNRNQKAIYMEIDIRNILQEPMYKYDIIFHLAAMARIQPSFVRPNYWGDVNICGTLEVLEFARKNNTPVVYAGSSSFYNDPLNSPYSFSKWCGEEACKMYSKIYKLPTAIARFFNVYGERQPNSEKDGTVIGIWERCYLTGNSIPIYGDGEQRRDFTHVQDICKGLLKISQKDWYGEIFNLGTGVNYTLNEIADMFQGAKKVHLPIRINEGNETLSPGNKELNWKAEIDIKDYLNHFVSSHK